MDWLRTNAVVSIVRTSLVVTAGIAVSGILYTFAIFITFTYEQALIPSIINNVPPPSSPLILNSPSVPPPMSPPPNPVYPPPKHPPIPPPSPPPPSPPLPESPPKSPPPLHPPPETPPSPPPPGLPFANFTHKVNLDLQVDGSLKLFEIASVQTHISNEFKNMSTSTHQPSVEVSQKNDNVIQISWSSMIYNGFQLMNSLPNLNISFLSSKSGFTIKNFTGPYIKYENKTQ